LSAGGELPLDCLVREDIQADFDALTPELQREAATFLLRLKREPLRSQRLEARSLGDLSDCRKVYFDESRHRIVFRLLPNEQQAERIEIIAVGPRKDAEVYRAALARLNRLAEAE